MKSRNFAVWIGSLVLLLGAFSCRYCHALSSSSYDFVLEPSLSQTVLAPQFTLTSEYFSFSNNQDPVYYELDVTIPRGLTATVYRIQDDAYQAVSLRKSYLALTTQKTNFVVEISPLPNTVLDEGEYTVDIMVRLRSTYTGVDTARQVQIEPVLHKYVLLSITKDGSMKPDPKLALFNLQDGPVILQGYPPHISTLVQNRGRYTFGLEGTLELKNSTGYHVSYPIRPTYVRAGSQKELTLPTTEDVSIPRGWERLDQGFYTASVSLSLLGTNMPKIYGQTYFLVIAPTTLIALLTVLLTIIMLVFIAGLRHT